LSWTAYLYGTSGEGYLVWNDAGEAFAELMDREAELKHLACFHFPRGFLDKDGTEMIAAIRRVTRKPSLPVKNLPWFIFKLASLFNETLTAACRSP
jgi:hypothetical protein